MYVCWCEASSTGIITMPVVAAAFPGFLRMARLASPLRLQALRLLVLFLWVRVLCV